jgi:hypothetical protein
MTEAVEHTSQHARADIDAECAAEGLHDCARVKTIELAERHEQHAALVKADHFGQHRVILRMTRDAAERAEADVETSRFHHEADDACDAPVRREAVGGFETRQHVVRGRHEVGRREVDDRGHACMFPMAR